MDEHVELSRQSWLGDFMQLFSWWPPFVRALEFLNNYFLPGVPDFDLNIFLLHNIFVDFYWAKNCESCECECKFQIFIARNLCAIVELIFRPLYYQRAYELWNVLSPLLRYRIKLQCAKLAKIRVKLQFQGKIVWLQQLRITYKDLEASVAFFFLPQ